MNDAQNSKQDAMTVYHAYWESYLKGEMEAMASCIDADFQVIGSTEGEVFLDKQETMQFYEATSDQIAGKVEFRNRSIQQKQTNGIVSVTEFSDAYILVDGEWVFYSKFRITSLLQKKEDGWKFVQQHGSIPDSKADEGEQVASEKIRQENLELRDAVKRRTVELESKNRELEIEAALERVRSIALSMKKPADMLEVCRVISDQLTQFNVKDIRNVQTAIINESKGTYLNYQYFAAYDQTVTEEAEYAKHPTVLEMVHAMQKSADSFFGGRLEGEKLEEFRKYREKENQFPDPILNKTEAAYYYFYSIGQGGLGVTTYKPLPEEGLDIFKRFHKVFRLAYRRFMDIEKAEAQAREAQIEASLERVRAKAMAMHSSKDLSSTVGIFFKELKGLGIIPIRCGVGQIDEATRTTNLTTTTSSQLGNSFDVIGKVKQTGHPVLDGIFENWKLQKEYHPVLQGEDIKAYYAVMNPQINYPEYREDVTQYGNLFYFREGFVFAWTENELSEEDLKIFRRFTSVVSLTFRRYLDLKEAEAQAREAMIEASLERVRSMALGMHRSEEVGRVSDVFFVEFNKLTLKLLGCSIVVIDEEKDIMELWRARSDVALKPFDKHSFSSTMTILKKNLPDFFPVFYKALQEKKDSLMFELSGNKRIQFFNTVTEQGKYSEEDKAKLFKSIPDNVVTHYIFFKLGYLVLISENILPDENLAIARRFIDVFDFAYTRFLDIRKAEAQARETQIELALERIRSQVTAMHESSDLLDIVVMMQAEFTKLGHEAHYFWHMRWLPDKYEKALTNGEGTRIGNVLELPRGFHGLQTMLDWEKTDEPSGVFALDPETAADYIDKMIRLGRFQEIDHSAPGPDEVRAMGGLTFVMARTTHGEIGYTLPGEVPNPPQEDIATLVRFAGVFDLAYRRFEDLQSAERRNRETQIELALERVRSRTMAMHSSEELSDVATVLFQQLTALGGQLWSCGFVLTDDVDESEFRMTNPEGDIEPPLYIPNDEDAAIRNLYIHGKKGDEYFFEEMDGEHLKCHYDYLLSLSKSGHVFQAILDAGIEFPIWQQNHAAYFSHGYLILITTEPYNDSEVLKRFAKVFEQTYTRFLDLENAEKQNKIILAENERKSLELEEARHMQLSMLPREIPQLENLEIAVHMQAATEVGGDYYDFSFRDDGSINIALGDATGHGMKAGIMVSAMKSIFTTNSSKMELEEFFNTANSGIKSMHLQRMMMGFTMMNIKNNTFQMINAGMPPVFFYRHKTRTVEELKEHSVPIGAMNHNQFKSVNGSLEKGDLLLLLTDGLPELQHYQSGELYGYARVKSLFEDIAEKAPEEIIRILRNEGSAWLNDRDPEDDVTFVVIKIK